MILLLQVVHKDQQRTITPLQQGKVQNQTRFNAPILLHRNHRLVRGVLVTRVFVAHKQQTRRRKNKIHNQLMIAILPVVGLLVRNRYRYRRRHYPPQVNVQHQQKTRRRKYKSHNRLVIIIILAVTLVLKTRHHRYRHRHCLPQVHQQQARRM